MACSVDYDCEFQGYFQRLTVFVINPHALHLARVGGAYKKSLTGLKRNSAKTIMISRTNRFFHLAGPSKNNTAFF
jgi:hypothetical protein